MINLDYLYNKDAVKNRLDKDYFSDKKLDFKIIEHGKVFPHKMFSLDRWKYGGGGVFDAEGVFVKDTYENYNAGVYYPRPANEEIHHSNETVIYLDVFGACWGNILAEHLSRVWFLKTDVFQKEFKNCRLVYAPRYDFNLTKNENKNFRRLLEILEVDVGALQPIEKPTQFEKVIVPDLSLFFDGYKKFTNEYRETIERVRSLALKNRTATPNKKVYYFHGRRALGEQLIANYFKSKGYTIISPEKLTLDEQLNWLINCESFASTLGSSSHNSVFLNDNTEVILIPRSNNLFPGYQELFDQVHSLNVSYIDSTLSIFHVNNGFFLYVVSPQLKKFFGDKFDGYAEEDFKVFLQYVNESLSRKLNVNNAAKIYYASILSDFMSQLQKREDLIASYNMPLDWEQFCPLLTYRTHVNVKGWGDGCWKSENQISNPLDEKLGIQAVKINFPGHKVYYSVYYDKKEGWSAEVSAPEMAGTTGKSKSIYGIRIRLDEDGAREFDILYRVHKFDDTWTPWAKNGEAIYSHGIRLNALQIKLESKKL